jgi:hypothetical protein
MSCDCVGARLGIYVYPRRSAMAPNIARPDSEGFLLSEPNPES